MGCGASSNASVAPKADTEAAKGKSAAAAPADGNVDSDEELSVVDYRVLNVKGADDEIVTERDPIEARKRYSKHRGAEVPAHTPGMPFVRMVVPKTILDDLKREDEADARFRIVGLDDSPNGEWEAIDIFGEDPAAFSELIARIATLSGAYELEMARAKEEREAAEEQRKQEAIKKAGDEEMEKEAEEEAERLRKLEKREFPDSRFSASASIKGQPELIKEGVPLVFRWAQEPTAFGEWNDPRGENFMTHTTGVRHARGQASEVWVEWRRGMNSEWQRARCDEGGVLHMTLRTPEKDEDGRGYQSRWIVDGRRYLSPLELAPTLLHRMEGIPQIAMALAKIDDPEKRTLDNVKPERLRKCLKRMENMLPQNTWDYFVDIDHVPGAVLDGVHKTTVLQGMRHNAQNLGNNRDMKFELRRLKLLAPLKAAVAGLGLLKIPAAKIAPNLETFYVPQATEPDLAELERVLQSELESDQQRRFLQRAINMSYPEWCGGLRVVLPPASALEMAIKCRRPAVSDEFVVPVRFEHRFKDSEWQARAAAGTLKVAVRFWRDDGAGEPRDVDLAVAETRENGKPAKPGTFVATVPLRQGGYRYHWVVDGDAYIDNGIAVDDVQGENENTYCVFNVVADVELGLGVVA